MILLKNITKDLFVKAGLNGFTIGRNKNGHLSIVGPCGKAIVDVTNFTVSSKLTKEEREISVNDYLIPILTKHKTVILDMIKYKEAESNAFEDMKTTIDALNKTNDDYILKYSTYYNNNEMFQAIIETKVNKSKDDDFIKIEKNQNDKLKLTIISSSTKASRETQKKILKIEKDLNTAYDLLIIYYKAKEDFRNASIKLQEECVL